MLDKLYEKHPTKALSLIHADYFACELGEGVFDAAVSFETLHHFEAEKKTRVFRKIYESLKSNGVYIECDYIAASKRIERLLLAESARRRERDGVADGVFVHFDTPLTLKHELDALKRAGFSEISLVEFLPNDPNTAVIAARK